MGTTLQRYWPLLAILLLGLYAPTQAQDTLRTEGDSVEVGTEGEGYVMTKSPGMAIVYAIPPGGGQLYTEQYWKVPLFVVPMGLFIGQAVYYQNQYSQKADEVSALAPDDPNYAFVKRQREFYRDNRDLNIAYYLGVHILSVVDAYVGAHLFDFDVDDSISGLYFFPDSPRNGIGVGYRW